MDAARLERFAQRAFAQCCALPKADLTDVATLPEISVMLVSDRRMAELHERFMQIAGPTDVLTFQHGEIVISVETARENARHFGHDFEDEIRLYLVHGFLHLLGFDDRTPKLTRAMEQAQTQIMRRLRSADGG